VRGQLAAEQSRSFCLEVISNISDNIKNELGNRQLDE
jgi:hypothetical protein